MTEAGTFFSRQSTGLKMLLVLGAALLPIGLVALFSSIETANAARENRTSEAELLAEVSAKRLSDILSRTALNARAAATSVAIDEANEGRCLSTLQAFSRRADYPVDFAVAGPGGNIVCATGGFAPENFRPPRNVSPMVIQLDEAGDDIILVVLGANDRASGIARIAANTLAEIAEPLESIGNFRMSLATERQEIVLHSWDTATIPGDARHVSQRIADDQMEFRAIFENSPLTLSENLSIALPVLMWLAAAGLGWFAVNRLVLNPLSRLQKAVSAYDSTGGEFTRPLRRSFAREIRELGEAFEAKIARQRANEIQLEDGLAEQIRLTREVHHRVKNNMQVIASLLNIHARGAHGPEATQAYASIRRRVEALAVVQRNILADSNIALGIPLRPVLTETAAGLSQGTGNEQKLSISMDIVDVRVSQDNTVPVAFLLTELTELALQSGKDTSLAILLGISPDGRIATMTISSPMLKNSEDYPGSDRYKRVITGLAQQLRSQVTKSESGESYSIDIPVIALAEVS